MNVKDQKPPVLTLQEAKVDMKDKGDPKLIIKEVKDASEVTFDFKYDKKHLMSVANTRSKSRQPMKMETPRQKQEL